MAEVAKSRTGSIPARSRNGRVAEERRVPQQFAEAVLTQIDRFKYDILVFFALLALVLAATAGFFAVIEHDGPELTHSVADIGGYVAIAGLVLGVPALIYAMVTDNNVGRLNNLADLIGAPMESIDETKDAVADRLAAFSESLPEDHFLQVFVPDRFRTHLVPLYDPKRRGPGVGWGIDPTTPQAITGSAWVGRSYLWGKGEELMQAKLRLTAEQVRRYADLVAVAAAPIFDEGRLVQVPGKPGKTQPDVIGVLTVFSTVESSVIGTDDFRRRHQAAANSLATIVEDRVPEPGALTQDDMSPQPR